MNLKYRWWDSVALPDDVDTCDEAEFRMQIKQLAFEVCLGIAVVLVLRKIAIKTLIITFNFSSHLNY